MIRYSDEILEDVRQSNDIVNIISQYVALKRKGRNYPLIRNARNKA